MIRTQIQLPDELYQAAKRIAAEQEITLAEVMRRGLEHMLQLYPPRPQAGQWRPPSARRLGPFRAQKEQWRDLANEAPPSSQ
jgi:hypothetical protein